MPFDVFRCLLKNFYAFWCFLMTFESLDVFWHLLMHFKAFLMSFDVFFNIFWCLLMLLDVSLMSIWCLLFSFDVVYWCVLMSFETFYISDVLWGLLHRYLRYFEVIWDLISHILLLKTIIFLYSLWESVFEGGMNRSARCAQS